MRKLYIHDLPGRMKFAIRWDLTSAGVKTPWLPDDSRTMKAGGSDVGANGATASVRLVLDWA